MSQILKYLKALSDNTRIRLIALLSLEELSVNELQQITGLGQSRISTHLGILQDANLIDFRKDGKKSVYKINPNTSDSAIQAVELAIKGAKENDFHVEDKRNLKRIVEKRDDQTHIYFNQVAGRFDQKYGPGRSWQALGQLLLRLIPPLDIADLGSGEGLVGELLARNARKVICVDNSKKIVQFGQRKAKRAGLKNIQFIHGDIESLPLKAKSVDVALFSHALHHARSPEKALSEAFRILRPDGRLIVLDLLEHQFENAKKLYGDHWLGFPKNTLHEWSENAGFTNSLITEAAREEEPPHFVTLLLVAQK